MRLPHTIPLVILLGVTPVFAETATRHNHPLLQAVDQSPALQAARERAAAALARTASSGRLPDPELELMASRVNTPSTSFPTWEITLRQPLPKAGERAADRARAEASVSMAEADYSMLAGEIAADTAMALSEADAAQQRIQLLQSQLARTEKVLSAVDARIATGTGRIAERLALQTRLADLLLMIDRDTRMAEDALSDARARLGFTPDAPLPPWSAPAATDIDPENAPPLRLFAARAEEARAMARMARASARPMTAIGLRLEREEEPMGDVDMVGLIFSTELPFRSRGYAQADQRAARAEESAARSDAAAELHRIASTITRAERATRVAATARRLAEETTRRIDAEYDALIRTSGVSSANMTSTETPVLMILELLDRQTETQLNVIEADAAARSAQAELWRYADVALQPTTP